MTNIETDLRDGVILIHLIERLTGNQIKAKYHTDPAHRIQKLDNMEVVINAMKEEGIQLVSASEWRALKCTGTSEILLNPLISRSSVANNYQLTRCYSRAQTATID